MVRFAQIKNKPLLKTFSRSLTIAILVLLDEAPDHGLEPQILILAIHIKLAHGHDHHDVLLTRQACLSQALHCLS